MRDVPSPAMRVRRQGSFQLDLPPAEAFKLFTAAGERLWVPGWSPTLLGALPQHPGLVFTTGRGSEHTVWTVLESDLATGRLRYSRVTPGSRAGIVTVRVTPAAGGSHVAVDYDLTTLGEDGEATLEAYSPDAFAEMMEAWRRLIVAMLAERRPDLLTLLV